MDTFSRRMLNMAAEKRCFFFFFLNKSGSGTGDVWIECPLFGHMIACQCHPNFPAVEPRTRRGARRSGHFFFQIFFCAWHLFVVFSPVFCYCRKQADIFFLFFIFEVSRTKEEKKMCSFRGQIVVACGWNEPMECLPVHDLFSFLRRRGGVFSPFVFPPPIRCSCYANAVLQCLTSTRPLLIYLLRRMHSRNCTLPRSDHHHCSFCEIADAGWPLPAAVWVGAVT